MLQNTCPVVAPQIWLTSSVDNKRAPWRLNTLLFILGSFLVTSFSLFRAQTYSAGTAVGGPSRCDVSIDEPAKFVAAMCRCWWERPASRRSGPSESVLWETVACRLVLQGIDPAFWFIVGLTQA